MKQKLIAWILIFVLLAGCTGCSEMPGPGSADDRTDNDTMKIFSSVYAMETPAYPQQVAYPMEDGFISGDDEEQQKLWDAWTEQYSTRIDASELYEGKLDHYLRTALPALMRPENEGSNAVCSPLNIWMALAMTAETAGGSTRQELLDLLGFDSVEELRKTAEALWTANYCDDGTSTSLLGASLWLNETVDFKKDTLKTLADQYYAATFRGKMADKAFSDAFRSWLDEHTGGLLKDNIAGIEDFDPDLVMALATTIYFKAKWTDEFREENTYQETFHGAKNDTETDFLHRSEAGDYYSDELFGAVQLPFEQAGSMWIILPDEGVTPEELLDSGEALAFLQRSWEEKNSKYLIIDMAIPKFDVNASMDLKTALSSLGLEEMFDPGRADFSNLTAMDGVYIGAASHDARVKIDEKGCEAAAFTVMMACGAAMPPEERMEFRVDRPFLFFITGTDGLPLFCGLVNELQ